MRRRNHSFQSEPLEQRVLLAGDLVAHWSAADLTGSNEQVVQQWTDRISQISAELHAGEPVLANGAVGGRAAVRFDNANGADSLRVASQDSPMSMANDFSFAVVFATSADDFRSGTNWFDATGLVDADRLGFADDWGLTINSQGQLMTGMGEALFAPIANVSSSATGLNDGQVRIAVVTRSGSSLSLYVDDQPANTINNASVDPRDSTVEISIGDVLSGGGGFTRRHCGDSLL
ncbi:MAG: LEPR-XLL domain-containing protein [Pirellulaceae bacterium]